MSKKIEPHLEEITEVLDDYLTQLAGEPVAFALEIFPDERGGRILYTSNAPRESALHNLKIMLANMTGGFTDDL